MEETKKKKYTHTRKKKDSIEMKLEDDNCQTKDFIYSQELNQHLLSEIAILTSENDTLKNSIKNQEKENENNSKLIGALKEEIRNIISSGGPTVSTKSSGLISSKITTLCKQNRHLVSELTLYKTKYGKLERKLIQIESELYTQNFRDKTYLLPTDKETVPIDQNELREVKDRLSQMVRKLADVKNKNADLKNELLLANKCLQSEIGPNFTSVQKLATDPVGFKGRAEEILVLKGKLSELEEKLNGKAKNIDQNKESYNQLIKDIENKRKNQMDKTVKDLENLQMEHFEFRQKYEGSLARNKILTCEITQLKQSLQALQDKTLWDEKVKEETMIQMKEMESKYQAKLAENEGVIAENQLIVERTKKDLENEKYRVVALNTKLDEKEEKIKYLNEKYSNVVDSSLQKIYYTPLQTAANNEIKILTDLLNKTNKRLEEERKKNAEFEKMYFRAKEAKLVMQRKYAKLGLELKEIKTKKTKSEGAIHLNCNMSTQSSISTLIHCSDKECVHFEVERTLNKLELASERIKYMEARLKILEDEKAADFESIDEMIFKSKKIFTEALKRCKEQK